MADDEDSGTDGEQPASDEVRSMYDQSGSSDGQAEDAGAGADSADGQTEAPAAPDESGTADDEGGQTPDFEDQLVEAGGGDPETATGTFYVKHAEDSSVTLHEVESGQIFTLVENPGFERHDIVEASLVAQPPMEVSYLTDEVVDHYSVPVETSRERPTSHVQELATELETGESVAIAREGEGEIHILRVDPDDVEHTAEELHEDELPYKNAARYGVGRVEIRTDGEAGIVSVRYLP